LSSELCGHGPSTWYRISQSRRCWTYGDGERPRSCSGSRSKTIRHAVPRQRVVRRNPRPELRRHDCEPRVEMRCLPPVARAFLHVVVHILELKSRPEAARGSRGRASYPRISRDAQAAPAGALSRRSRTGSGSQARGVGSSRRKRFWGRIALPHRTALAQKGSVEVHSRPLVDPVRRPFVKRALRRTETNFGRSSRMNRQWSSGSMVSYVCRTAVRKFLTIVQRAGF